MRDAVDFHETGAKWFRLMRIVIASAAVMAVLLGIFSVYQPRKLRHEGSDWSAFIAIIAVAGFFAAGFGVFGVWHQWRKPLRLGVSSKGVVLGDDQPYIPWSTVDRFAIHWWGQRFENTGAVKGSRPMRSRLALLVYARGGVAQPAAKGVGESFNRTWYGTPHMVELGLLDASIDDVLQAIRQYAPRDVLARSGLLEV